MLKGNIFITGGSGSLGTAILHQAKAEKWPATFTVIARNEPKMNAVRQQFPDARCEIGDVRDFHWLKTIMPGHNVVIHAGAIKVVPTAEVNVRETVLTNVNGSMNVAMAAVESGVERVIGVSTDKACNPTTIYGSTKHLMEGIFREANSWSSFTSFMLVRYGNVLRSAMSVVPFFEKLIREGKPLTITDYRMTRFWLGMHSGAIDLIQQAVNWPFTPGVILVPKAPMLSMVELAYALAGDDYPIQETGIRPGEKIHEEMVHEGELLHTIEFDKLCVINAPNKPVAMPMKAPYSSRTAPKLTKEQLYALLNEYNPYGGPDYESPRT